MPKSLLLLLVICIVNGLAGAAESQPLVCFQRGYDMWVAKLDGSEAKKIGRGSSPAISPDGTRIAFHTDSSSDELERRIAVADIGTGKVTIFKDQIPSNNCQAVVWSPIGDHLLFSIYTDSDWHLAMVNADGTDFRYVKKAEPKGNSLWSACWAPDGKSFYAQDFNKLYQLDLNGAVLKKWNLSYFFPKGSFNSGSRFAVSPDGSNLLVAADMDENIELDDWDGGPPPTLWSLNLKTEKVTRLTPKGMLAMEGCWLSADEVLFVSQGNKDKNPSIFRVSTSGKERQLFLKNASFPSVSSH